MTLRTYRVVNEELARQLALQLGIAVDVETATESEVRGGISSFGAARRKSHKVSTGRLDDPRLLDEIVEGLRSHGQLKIYRPERMRDRPDGPTFVHEVNVQGTPVYLPIKDRPEAPLGIRGLTVWVFEPLGHELGFIDSEPDGSFAWDWIGTYLFLVEEHVSDSGQPCCWSGISALRFIVGAMAGHDPDLINQARGFLSLDKFGRDDYTPPIEKMRRVGATPLRPRRVEIVYQIVEMTNEQATTINGKEIRLNDIFAYPLYIATL